MAWRDKIGEDLNGLYLGKLEYRWPDFFQVYLSVHENDMNNALQTSLFVMWPWFCQQKIVALQI